MCHAPSSIIERALQVFGGAAGLQATIDHACELANKAVVFGGDVGGKERTRLDVAMQSLYYINQAVNTAGVAASLLRSGGADAGGSAEDAAGTGGTSSGVGIREVSDDALVAGVARFVPVDPEETNRMQQLLLYLLNCAQARGYRRGGVDCYRRVLTPSGHDSRAWERASSIREFVFEVTRKESNYDMWLNLTSGHTNLGCAVDHLANCCDVQFPDLCKDRHVFSFRNGLYMADRDEFVGHDSPAAAMLPSALVAARYFDAEFDPHTDLQPDDWAQVPTPNLQSIMDFQGMSAEVCRWLYVMIGRLIYEVGERDGWQVLPYLKGAASSGKSTILVRVCRGLYDATDVGVLSNNIERKFGLSALYDKLLFIGPEIKSDTSLEQAEFQSIVSGETVQVAAKFKTAQSVEWRVPGILAGNQVPAWVDNSGSISRRILLFRFSRRVDNGDMLLGQKLEAEMPQIILKVNRAYLHATRLHARENVWRHVPPELVNAKDELTEDVNSLVHFLRNGGLTYGSGLYMPMREFKDMYLQYCRESGFKNLQMKREVYEQPLIGAGCYVSGQQTLVYRGVPTKEQFLMGASSSSCGNRREEEEEEGCADAAGCLRDPLGDD